MLFGPLELSIHERISNRTSSTERHLRGAAHGPHPSWLVVKHSWFVQRSLRAFRVADAPRDCRLSESGGQGTVA
jgi:hypothetical protein